MCVCTCVFVCVCMFVCLPGLALACAHVRAHRRMHACAEIAFIAADYFLVMCNELQSLLQMLLLLP